MLDFFDIGSKLGLPENASVQGIKIDFWLGMVHWLMFILFAFWAVFFIYTLVRFRRGRNAKANHEGAKGSFSKYLEGGVVMAEIVLLFAFAVPTWGELRDDLPDEQDATVVNVIAEQFAWNIHYPGPDSTFGRRDPDLVDVQLNPLGLDRSDPAAQDDIVTVNELHLPVDKPVLIHLTSKDVIHSFSLPVMRVKQDAIPGLMIPVWFVPNKTGEWEIACAQLCGLSHYRMRGYLTVESQQDFDAWLAENAPEQEEAPAPPAQDDDAQAE